jgi:hypothetical protein
MRVPRLGRKGGKLICTKTDLQNVLCWLTFYFLFGLCDGQRQVGFCEIPSLESFNSAGVGSGVVGVDEQHGPHLHLELLGGPGMWFKQPCGMFLPS